jgi:hypothetical protein
MPRPLIFLAFAFALCSAAAAQPAPAEAQIKDIQIPRIATKPRIEEFLDGHSRADMLRIDDFRQRNPGDGVPLSLKTAAWIGWDDKNFYVVFVCAAPPGEVRARLGKREDIFSDDFVGIFFDTWHDHQRAYEFFVNPLGVQADGITVESRDDDFSFDTLWYSDGRLTPDGYVTMMTIPFRSLRFTAKEAQVWGFGVGRWIPTRNENGFWPYISNRLNSFSPQLANLSGLESISPGRNIQLIPYAALGHAHFLDDPGTTGSIPDFRSTTDRRGGLDAKMVLHDSLTLDVALRPDFSQVESDDPQVTVNQRYEVQFSEKRPFFIENNGFFQTRENLFFSRRIIDPRYGARLTGKVGRWNMGLLTIDDRAPGVEAGPADPHYLEDAVIGVGRIQREFGSQSNIGALFTDRAFGGGFNRVGAVDTRLHLHKTWYLAAQAMASQTQDTHHVRSGGDAFNVSLNSGTRHYYYNLNYIDRGEGFHTDLGFVNRVDIRQLEQYAQYRFRPKSGVLVSWGPSLELVGDLDHRNAQQDWQARPGFQVEMKRATYLNVNHAEMFERFNGINFRREDSFAGGHSEYFKFVTLDAGVAWGTRINYSTPSGVTPFLGRGNEINVNLTFRPSSRIKIDEIYDLTRLKTMGPHPEAVFVNHLLRSRLNYQYNRQLSLRVIVDYNALLDNPALFDSSRQKRVTGDILVTWLLNPGTAVYVGYTDTLENQALLAGTPNTVVRTNLPSVTTQRQFFAKVSYLFRF